MSISARADRRVRDRSLSKGELKGEDVAKELLALPDSAGDVQECTREELEKLQETLVAEKRVRDERIEVARLRRPAIVQPVHATMPLDDEHM